MIDRKGTWRSCIIMLAMCCSAATYGNETASPDFEKDILPTFRRFCFECHGPMRQEADLRLDDPESAFAHYSAIVPGDAAASEIYRRITLPAGHDEIMPAVGRPLTKDQTEPIRLWLEAGAEWPNDIQPATHWAYVSPSRSVLPEISQGSWPRNEIDFFILSRLEDLGLNPSPEADPATRIRRVYLDLIGIPPTPREVEAFVADPSDESYANIVDHLLASPQFGERWARPWLDLARYSDSHGFQRDNLREIWAYRDWVIQALNADMPFDQFTIEQLAGDLLPSPTEEQKIATGFHRCATINVEAGSDPEETRCNQVFDRVNTTATVWMGSTLECAQCHDHKFDPFTQKEYYQLFAFFNNTEIEADRTNPAAPASIKFLGPRMQLTDDSTEVERRELKAQLQVIDEQIASRTSALQANSAQWEASLPGKCAADSRVTTEGLSLGRRGRPSHSE